MDYGRYGSSGAGDWSHNIKGDDTIISVYNSNGEDRKLAAIQVRLATGLGSATDTGTGTRIYGNGSPIDVFLYVDYGGARYHSTHCTVTNVESNVQYDRSYGYYFQISSNIQYYTFYFDGPVVAPWDSLAVRFHTDNTSTWLVCPKAPINGQAEGSGNRRSYVYGSDSSPYTPNNYSLNSVSPTIGKYNDTNYTLNYTIDGGTNGLDWVIAKQYSDNGTYLGQYGGFSTNRGSGMTKALKLVYGGTGAKSRLSIRFSDNVSEYETGTIDVYTYVLPYVNSMKLIANNISSGNKFSPQDNAKIQYKTNGRKWTSYENNFTTTITLNGSTYNASNQNPTNSTNGADVSSINEESLSESILNAKYSNVERSVEQLSSTMRITRHSSSAPYSEYSEYPFVVQYKPTNAPTGGDVKQTGTNTSVKGSTIIVQDIPSITIDWAYNKNSGAAGVVNGYEIKVFSDSNYSSQVGTAQYISGTSISLNTQSQLKRGVMNYIQITPYYTRPDGNGRILGSNKYRGQLVKPINKLSAPIINYPINNTTWHNKYFRVLVQLPEDSDLSTLISDGTIADENAYRYEDIEIKITPNGSSAVTYKTNTSAIWSKTISNIKHKDKIAICPALSSLTDASSYTISVRVRKKYYNLTEAQSWSNYATITLNKTAVSNLSLSAGQIISINHYKTIRDASVRCHSVYPIQSLDSRNVVQSVGDQIDYSEYQGIYNTILGIKNSVNGYCTYDNTSVSFTRTIDDLTNNPPKQEYITAERTPSGIDGRNYMNILIDDLNQLY